MERLPGCQQQPATIAILDEARGNGWEVPWRAGVRFKAYLNRSGPEDNTFHLNIDFNQDGSLDKATLWSNDASWVITQHEDIVTEDRLRAVMAHLPGTEQPSGGQTQADDAGRAHHRLDRLASSPQDPTGPQLDLP